MLAMVVMAEHKQKVALELLLGAVQVRLLLVVLATAETEVTRLKPVLVEAAEAATTVVVAVLVLQAVPGEAEAVPGA